jgi:flavin-dependent dehydrogenase
MRVMLPTNPYDMLKHDVIIVGSGPAGISTALHLAQIAPELVSRTLILEKARHPRPKLCGGGIMADGEVILHHLGLDITEVPHVDADWAHLDFDGDGMRIRSDRKGKFALRVVRRHEFDAWLAGKAREQGFLIQENTTVKSLEVGESGVRLVTDKGEYKATIVVGADGSNSVVRRAIIPPDEPQHVARLLEIITEPKPEKSFHKQSDAYFDFVVTSQGIQGYVWDFPAIENGRPVRVRGIYDSNMNDTPADLPLRDALGEDFQRHGLNLGNYELHGFPIRWFDARSTFSAPHILLAGDAVGADAIFGEGISPALGYGELAARAIRDAFNRQDFSFRGYKRSILKSELGKALGVRTCFARILLGIRWPAFHIFLWYMMRWPVEWVARAFVIGWARRQERKG